MKVDIEHITDVDKKITLFANRNEDLDDLFDKAYRKYQSKIHISGFRVGKVPLSLIKKRYGEKIEQEELNNYISNVLEKDIRPKYDIIEDVEMQSFQWENGQLKAVFCAGKTPKISIDNLKETKIDIIDIEITDEHIEDTMKYQLKDKLNWKETEAPIALSDKAIVDMTMDNEDIKDNGVELVISECEPVLQKALVGKKKGDIVTVSLPKNDGKEHMSSCKVVVQHVLNSQLPELTDQFINNWNSKMKTVKDYKNHVRKQLYAMAYTESEKLFRNLSSNILVDKCNFSVPKVTTKRIEKEYIKMKTKEIERNPSQDTPKMDDYINQLQQQIEKDGKWAFIYQYLLGKLPHKELHKDQIDAFFNDETKKMGLDIDMIRAYYSANNQRLEQLKQLVLEHSVFSYIKSEVTLVPISRDLYIEKHIKSISK